MSDDELPKYGPKEADHVSVGEKCAACRKPFQAGDFTTLIVIGPGDDPDSRRAALRGRPYNAVACATGDES